MITSDESNLIASIFIRNRGINTHVPSDAMSISEEFYWF